MLPECLRTALSLLAPSLLFAPASLASQLAVSKFFEKNSGYIWIWIVVVIVTVCVELVVDPERARSKKIDAVASSLSLTFRRKPTEADKARVERERLPGVDIAPDRETFLLSFGKREE